MTNEEPAQLRAMIHATEIITALENHILGEGNKMTASQVAAALALLRKILPDIARGAEEEGGHEAALDALE